MSNETKAKEKKKVLNEDFDIAMSSELEREVEGMCNLSEGLIEKGMKKGIQQGEQNGILTAIRGLMKNLSVTFEQAVEMLGIPTSEREKYKKLIKED